MLNKSGRLQMHSCLFEDPFMGISVSWVLLLTISSPNLLKKNSGIYQTHAFFSPSDSFTCWWVVCGTLSSCSRNALSDYAHVSKLPSFSSDWLLWHASLSGFLLGGCILQSPLHLVWHACMSHPEEQPLPLPPTGCSHCCGCHIYSMSSCCPCSTSTHVTQGWQFNDLSPSPSTEFICNLQSKQFLAVSLPGCDL